MTEKYIIELEPLLMNSNGKVTMWKAINFNTLVFDDNGIKKLQRYEDPNVVRTDAIKVGDIVKNKKSPDAKMIVTSVISERKVVYINGIECGTNACGDYGGAAYSYCIADDWEKTGDSVPEIISWIKTVGACNAEGRR